LHNKPLGCGASEVYASGPACEEEEDLNLTLSKERKQRQGLVETNNCNPRILALNCKTYTVVLATI